MGEIRQKRSATQIKGRLFVSLFSRRLPTYYSGERVRGQVLSGTNPDLRGFWWQTGFLRISFLWQLVSEHVGWYNSLGHRTIEYQLGRDDKELPWQEVAES